MACFIMELLLCSGVGTYDCHGVVTLQFCSSTYVLCPSYTSTYTLCITVELLLSIQQFQYILINLEFQFVGCLHLVIVTACVQVF